MSVDLGVPFCEGSLSRYYFPGYLSVFGIDPCGYTAVVGTDPGAVNMEGFIDVLRIERNGDIVSMVVARDAGLQLLHAGSLRKLLIFILGKRKRVSVGSEIGEGSFTRVMLYGACARRAVRAYTGCDPHASRTVHMPPRGKRAFVPMFR